MKALAYLAIATLIGLTLAAGSVQAGPIFPNRTIDLRFNGFCDGLHFTTNTSNGVVVGFRTGCSSGAVGGVIGHVLEMARVEL